MSPLHRRISNGGLALLAMVTLLVLAVPVAAAAPPDGPSTQGPPKRQLTVLSYNLHHGVGVDGALDLDRVAAVIRDSGADVVALQEVDRHWSARSEFVDQAAVLADKLGMHHAYGANLDRDQPAPERAKLEHVVTTAHSDDRRVRFWETPHQPGPARQDLWTALIEADVDHINTDDLAGLQAFLLERDSDRGRQMLLTANDMWDRPYTLCRNRPLSSRCRETSDRRPATGEPDRPAPLPLP